MLDSIRSTMSGVRDRFRRFRHRGPAQFSSGQEFPQEDLNSGECKKYCFAFFAITMVITGLAVMIICISALNADSSISDTIETLVSGGEEATGGGGEEEAGSNVAKPLRERLQLHLGNLDDYGDEATVEQRVQMRKVLREIDDLSEDARKQLVKFAADQDQVLFKNYDSDQIIPTTKPHNFDEFCRQIKWSLMSLDEQVEQLLELEDGEISILDKDFDAVFDEVMKEINNLDAEERSSLLEDIDEFLKTDGEAFVETDDIDSSKKVSSTIRWALKPLDEKIELMLTVAEGETPEGDALGDVMKLLKALKAEENTDLQKVDAIKDIMDSDTLDIYVNQDDAATVEEFKSCIRWGLWSGEERVAKLLNYVNAITDADDEIDADILAKYTDALETEFKSLSAETCNALLVEFDMTGTFDSNIEDHQTFLSGIRGKLESHVPWIGVYADIETIVKPTHYNGYGATLDTEKMEDVLLDINELNTKASLQALQSKFIDNYTSVDTSTPFRSAVAQINAAIEAKLDA